MEEKAEPRVPARLIARLLSEVQQAMVAHVASFLAQHGSAPGQFERAVLFVTVLRADPRFRAAATGVAGVGDTAAGGISINATAATLNRPFETIRRHANVLRKAGLVDAGPRGLVIAETLEQGEAFAGLLRWLHDMIVSLFDDAARLGVTLPSPRRDLPYSAETTIAAGLDLALTPIEFVVQAYRSWAELLLVNAVIVASIREITYDRELAWRYAWAETPPPPELRRPASIRRIAQGHGLAYSTVSRHIGAAIDRGLLIRRRGGVVASDALLSDEKFTRAAADLSSRAAQTFRRLLPGGFPFDDPSSAYFDGRPPRIAL